MDIYIENVLTLDDFDIVQTVGYRAAYLYTVPTPIRVTDGNLTIQFVPSLENPMISGIEVLLATTVTVPISVPIPVPVPISVPIPVPVVVPTKAPTKVPTKAPTKTPTKSPTKTPTKAPTPIATPPTPVTVVPPTSASGTVLYRINCGSTTAVTDTNGTVWSADQYFASGSTFVTCPTTNTTTNNNIYCSSRFFRSIYGTPFTYNLPVSQNGTYLLQLHFAEQYYTSGNKRKFDVSIEGVLVLDDFDIYSTAPPGRNIPKVISVGTTVTDGSITILFITGPNNYPQINGIEVISLGPPAPPAPPPTPAPVLPVPTASPIALPPTAPIAIPPTAPVALAPTAPVAQAPTVPFADLLINCGGT
jgi:Malectin domain